MPGGASVARNRYDALLLPSRTSSRRRHVSVAVGVGVGARVRGRSSGSETVSVKEMPFTPDFSWAQRKDKVFVTVKVPNVKKDTAILKVTPEGQVYFKGIGGELGHEREYELDIRLLHEIKADEAQCGVQARQVYFVLPKAEAGQWWPRLLHDPGRNVHLSVDWGLWVDEDEDDQFDFGSHFGSRDMADLDFGMGDDDDADDEDIDDDDDLGNDDLDGTAPDEAGAPTAENHAEGDEQVDENDVVKSEEGAVAGAAKVAGKVAGEQSTATSTEQAAV